MKNNPKLTLIVSLLVVVGIPVCFFIVSLATGNWNFFYFSLIPGWVLGIVSVVHSIQQLKKAK
ncbi:hypothetical protein QGM71_19760 [Virgibacillus sp. C22-A2]|uniref:Uncharacterized protein n=1 Tax=Virgibacillus tibetensis TaxID=3042313 RepID=A0ABU6KLD4_9BACI|nr:hypothetical protein [Virgibacillus sp. C22-A2]